MAWLRLSNRSLGAQFWVAGSIVGIFSVASLLLLLNQVSRQTEASRWLARTHRTISRLNSLGRDYYQHRTLLRGYLELPEGKRLEQARERGPLWQKGLEAVRDSIALEPDAQAPLDQVAKDHENWLRQAEGLTLNRPMDMVDREGELGYESELFEKTWNGIDALIDRFNRQLSVRDLEDKQAVQHTFAAVAVINIALLLVFGVVLLNLYQSIARPIAALSTGIRRYMGGDFRARVRVGYPRSDIGYLQSSYNEL
ncbi:MAG TPA: hypothetical protein VL588_08025, partial [Bdellovibrionota bacterium]|nr:hypothetical protein [Bdellovibrionota bacterium]